MTQSIAAGLFKTILQANDGSEPAFHAFELALAIAEQNGAALHMVCVEELPHLPEFIEDVRQVTEAAERRFAGVVKRARDLAAARGQKLETHVIVGHPARDVAALAERLPADLLIIGATGHSEIYQRLIGSRADRMVALAPCPVLVVK
jgi:nucleotide-binding universal stress UspA family protein